MAQRAQGQAQVGDPGSPWGARRGGRGRSSSESRLGSDWCCVQENMEPTRGVAGRALWGAKRRTSSGEMWVLRPRVSGGTHSLGAQGRAPALGTGGGRKGMRLRRGPRKTGLPGVRTRTWSSRGPPGKGRDPLWTLQPRWQWGPGSGGDRPAPGLRAPNRAFPSPTGSKPWILAE